MTPRPTLAETIAAAEFAEDVNIWNVTFPDDPHGFCLLSSSNFLTFAFLMAKMPNPGHFCQMAFRWPNDEHRSRYPVLSSSYPQNRDSFKERALAERFRQAVENACCAHGITVLFVRNAASWEHRFGRMDGITVLEAQAHQYEMVKAQNDPDAVHAAFQFIDYGASRGLKERKKDADLPAESQQQPPSD